MVDEGDTAPDFTAPKAIPDHAGAVGEYTADAVTAFTLSEAVGEAPIVLAFFPGAFTRTCTQEMCAVRDWRGELAENEAQVYGVSADTPWSLLAFIEEYDLTYPLLSGFNNSVIEDYGVAIDAGLLDGIAGRAVFVIDGSRTVTYRWISQTPGTLPDLDRVEDAIAAA